MVHFFLLNSFFFFNMSNDFFFLNYFFGFWFRVPWFFNSLNSLGIEHFPPKCLFLLTSVCLSLLTTGSEPCQQGLGLCLPLCQVCMLGPGWWEEEMLMEGNGPRFICCALQWKPLSLFPFEAF